MDEQIQIEQAPRKQIEEEPEKPTGQEDVVKREQEKFAELEEKKKVLRDDLEKARDEGQKIVNEREEEEEGFAKKIEIAKKQNELQQEQLQLLKGEQIDAENRRKSEMKQMRKELIQKAADDNKKIENEEAGFIDEISGDVVINDQTVPRHIFSEGDFIKLKQSARRANKIVNTGNVYCMMDTPLNYPEKNNVPPLWEDIVKNDELDNLVKVKKINELEGWINRGIFGYPGENELKENYKNMDNVTIKRILIKKRGEEGADKRKTPILNGNIILKNIKSFMKYKLIDKKDDNIFPYGEKKDGLELYHLKLYTYLISKYPDNNEFLDIIEEIKKGIAQYSVLNELVADIDDANKHDTFLNKFMREKEDLDCDLNDIVLLESDANEGETQKDKGALPSKDVSGLENLSVDTLFILGNKVSGYNIEECFSRTSGILESITSTLKHFHCSLPIFKYIKGDFDKMKNLINDIKGSLKDRNNTEAIDQIYADLFYSNDILLIKEVEDFNKRHIKLQEITSPGQRIYRFISFVYLKRVYEFNKYMNTIQNITKLFRYISKLIVSKEYKEYKERSEVVARQVAGEKKSEESGQVVRTNAQDSTWRHQILSRELEPAGEKKGKESGQVVLPSRPEPETDEATFHEGQAVMRRDGGKTSRTGWKLGFVTSVQPLLVTASTNANSQGFKWEEVRRATPKEINKFTTREEQETAALRGW